MNTNISLHGLDAHAFLINRALQHDSGSVSVTLNDHTQLHFASHADMVAFGMTLAAMPIKRMVEAA